MKYPRFSKSRSEIIIITKSVPMKWVTRTRAHYESLGYKFTAFGDEFVCAVKHLTKSSNVPVDVCCPICNQVRTVIYNDLIRIGHSLCMSCGQIGDIAGEKFGRWSVTHLDIDKTIGGSAYWVCRCECGIIRSITANSLITGNSTSCGCYQKETMLGEGGRFWKGGPVTVCCDYCGTEYKVQRCKEKDARFCSRQCSQNWKSENLSGDRASNWRGGPLSINCDQCGKEFERWPSRIEKSKNNFCSHRCYSEWMSENIIGEAHHNWNPEITDEERYIGRNYPEYRKWIQDVLTRDNYTCQICGKEHDVEAHHLYSYMAYPEHALDIDNGLTLCCDHHREFHKWMGGTSVPCVPSDIDRWLYST